jgi:predicted  nucleic acid-binding Zn-ribbon protein
MDAAWRKETRACLEATEACREKAKTNRTRTEAALEEIKTTVHNHQFREAHGHKRMADPEEQTRN